jgi:hypothetical protein
MPMPRFRLRSLILAIAVIALALALFIQSVRLQMFQARTEQAIAAERRARDAAELARQQAARLRQVLSSSTP